MSPPVIGFAEGERHLDWMELVAALDAGHHLPPAEIADSFLYRGDDTLLTRSAWIDGMGIAVKAATVFPGNPAQDLSTVNGGVSLFDDRTGALRAVIDFHLVTKWKTAADSLLAALRLARPDSRRILILGAGRVARAMVQAYSAGFAGAEFTFWSRTVESAEALAAETGGDVALDLPAAVAQADIICCATMASDPILRGGWLRPGQHIDLIGAYRPDMREADDEALRRARVFVDSRQTVLDHIGELRIPLSRGVITRDDVVADFRDIASGAFARGAEDEITLCKNGGGAHLDLMTSDYILRKWQAAGGAD